MYFRNPPRCPPERRRHHHLFQAAAESDRHTDGHRTPTAHAVPRMQRDGQGGQAAGSSGPDVRIGRQCLRRGLQSDTEGDSEWTGLYCVQNEVIILRYIGILVVVNVIYGFLLVNGFVVRVSTDGI